MSFLPPINTPPVTFPTGSFAGDVAPYSNVTPFTHRDARTMTGQVEALIYWINNQFITWNNEEINRLVAAVNEQYRQFREVFIEFTEVTREDQAAFKAATEASQAAFKATTEAQQKAFTDVVHAAEALITAASKHVDDGVAAAAASANEAERWNAATEALQDLAVSNLLKTDNSQSRTTLNSLALSLRALSTPDFFLGDKRWDNGRYTGQAIKEILAFASKGNAGIPIVTIRPGASPEPIILTETVEVYRTALHLIGLGVGNASDYTANPGRGTVIRWAGPTGVPMFKVRDSRHVHISDIQFQGSTANPPSCAINLNAVTGDTTGTNGYITIERCHFGFMSWLPGTTGWQMDYGILVDGINANNDQFYVRDCRFSRCTIAGVRLANSQSIFGSFENCEFEGNYVSKGIETNASVSLYNAQFGQCTVDLEIGTSARVTDISHHSERSGRIATLTNNAARLTMHGGYIGLNGDYSTYAFDVTSLGGYGALCIHGTAFYNAAVSAKPKIRVRGSSSVATPGELSIVGVTGLDPADFDIQGGIGTNRKMRVFIQCGEISLNRLVTGVTTEVVPVTAMTA